MEFSAKLAYSDVDSPTKESDWKFLQRVDNQIRPLICSFMGESRYTNENAASLFS